VGLTALVLLALGSVSGAVAWQRHQHALDAHAAAQVSLLVGDFHGQLQDGLEFQLLNAGPATVRLLSVGLGGGAGYPQRRVNLSVAAHSDVDVLVPEGTRCDPSLLTAAPPRLELRLRTARGTVVRRVLPLEADTASSVRALERGRCGLLTPDEAVHLEPFSVTTVGRAVLVKAYLSNGSNVPVTVEHLTAVPGLEVIAPLPLTVPGTVGGVSTPTLTKLQLTVLDCALFARSVGAAPGGQQPDELLARVRSSYGSATARLQLTQLSGGPGNGPDVLPLVPLLAQCPGLTTAPSGAG
jgi:hypothetical protein